MKHLPGSWQVRCLTCGLAVESNEVGIIRWKAGGRFYRLGKCSRCIRIRCLVTERVSSTAFLDDDSDRWINQAFFEACGDTEFDDVRQVEEAVIRMTDGLTDRLPSQWLDSIERHAPKMLKAYRKDFARFRFRLHKLWGQAFDYLVIEYHLARELGRFWCIRTSREGDAEEIKSGAVARLHARACSLTAEILELLMGGFAAGANARWRTLHEVTVIAAFLAQHDEELSQRYCDFFTIEVLRSMRTYQESCQFTGCDPLSKEEMQEYVLKSDELKAVYGDPFVGVDYGWAADVLGLPKVTFRTIEAATQLQLFRPSYTVSCRDIHAGPRALFDIPGLMGDKDILLAGASNAGLMEPGCNTAQSLAQITCTMLGLSPTVSNSIGLSVLTQITRRAQDEFVKAAEELERREAALSSGSDAKNTR